MEGIEIDKKKKNNRGFTFVEILAVIVLIGVLSSIAIVGVTRYRENAKSKDYEALAKSSYNAMEEYMMAHPYSKTASLEVLEDGSFLSNRKDPATKNTDCTGSVEVIKDTGTGGNLDDGTYAVYLCCTNYKKKYSYPGGTVENYTGTDKCSAEAEPEPEVPTPPPGETSYTITYVLNGGRIAGNPTRYSASMLPLTLKQPSRNGYTFTGWTGSNGSTPQKTVTLPKGTTGNKTYSAHWSANPTTSYCSVTLNASGATSSGTKSVRVKVGATKLPTITPPRKVATIRYVNNVGATVKGGERSKNYPLSGWFTKPTSGSKVASNATTPILQSGVSGYTTAKGTWSKKGSAVLYSQWGNANVTLPTITKANSICRWRTSSGSTVGSGGTARITGTNTVTFTATCEAITTYTIKYNLDGGTDTGNPSTYTKNSATITLKQPKKLGFEFTGWTGTGLTKATMTVTIPTGSTGNREYTAHWKLTKPYVDNNGNPYATLAEAVSKVSNGGSISLVSSLQSYTDNGDGNKLILKGSSKTINLNFKNYQGSKEQVVTLTKDSFTVLSGTIKFNSGTIITSSKNQSAVVVKGGTFIVNGGTLKNPFNTKKQEDTEAVLVTGSGVLKLLKGTIQSGNGDSSGYGRGVNVTHGGKFYMSGGKVLVNATYVDKKKKEGWGGTGVNAYNGRMEISGGTIRVVKSGPGRCLICSNQGSRIIVTDKTSLMWGDVVRTDRPKPSVYWADDNSRICVEKTVKESFNLNHTPKYAGGGSIKLNQKKCK